MTITNHNSPLINADQLNKILNDPHVKIFDVRGKWSTSPVASIDEYHNAHISGATFLDWRNHFLETDVATHLSPVANKQNAQKAFNDLGINSEDMVILYDDYHHMLAGRIWWSMRYWGFDNVKVLNGGWNHWIKQELSTSKTIPLVFQGNFIVNEQSHLKSSIHDVAHRSHNTCLLDARGSIYYQGKTSDPRSGHIHGAVNLPYYEMLDQKTGLFKDKQSLQRLFEQQLNAVFNEEVIASCGSGYAATVVMLALKSIDIDVPLFDDSYSVWKQNESLPIEQGRSPNTI